MDTIRFLAEPDLLPIVRSVSTEEYIDAVREGYRQHGFGAPANPRQTLHTHPGSEETLANYMTILPETGAMGGCLYNWGFEPDNAQSFVTLFESDTGDPLAVVDGTSWNARKTGAVGAVGVDELANEGASTVGVLGSGVVARWLLRCTTSVRDVGRVRVYSPTPDHRRRFASEMDRELAPDVGAVTTNMEAVTDADVVLTATSSDTPVFDGDSVASGAHVVTVGATAPQAREIDETTMRRAVYVPDIRDRVVEDAGAVRADKSAGAVPNDHVFADLGEVVTGSVDPATGSGDIRVFDSGGTAIETVAVAALLYRRAERQDVGDVVSV
jgi:alanine dehydrogenase